MPANVTSNVVAALMTKLELLFGKADDRSGLAGNNSFVSFQLPAIPLSVRELSFRLPASESGLTPQEEKNFASDFARLVNLIPTVSSIWASDGRTLWDEYETILTQAMVADDDPTTNEGTELQQARTLLESSKYAAYQEYMKAYMSALEKYNELKLKADNSSDPKLQEDWKLQEPGYKAMLKNAYLEWVAKGFKLEIEEAFADIDRIGGRNPQLLWATWKDDFNKSLRSDMEGQDFYETHFFPENFVKSNSQGQWTKLTLDASEIIALSAKAPEGIRNLASSSGSAADTQALDIEISRLSVELIRVPIIRSWLQPSIFRSNFWKWSGGRELLSDGQNPPRGSLPAYITSMILARNLEVELKPGSEKNAQIVSKLQQGKLVLLGPLPLKPLPKNVDPKSIVKLNASTISMKRVEPAVAELVIASQAETKLSSASLDMLAKQRNIQTINPNVAGNLRAASFGTLSASKTSAVNAASVYQMNPALLDRVVASQLSEQAKVSSVSSAAKPLNPQVLDSPIFVNPTKIPPNKPNFPKLIEKPSSPTPETAPSDSVQIIAFICQKLPKSPNPDPALTW
jgi:hypothetical protein